MKKTGILTFHYSNNYGGVLQALFLQNAVRSMGYDAEIINFIPSDYKAHSIMRSLGIRRNIFKNKTKGLSMDIYKKISIMNTYGRSITSKFDAFREKEMILSKQVDESSLQEILNDYETIIAGSDQIWNPSQRQKPEYFLDFGKKFIGRKISYASDSTTKDVNRNDEERLRNALSEFSHISVRNQHSYEFVSSITNKEVEIVADPTLIYDFDDNNEVKDVEEGYILMYVLGKEISGTHIKTIEKIKMKFKDLPVYSIKIPTMNFELSSFADKTFYDLNPYEWLTIFKKAKFVYTDSFHGVLFSLKYHKPFLAYYIEKLRATRLVDLGQKYDITKYIVQNTDEIDNKKSLDTLPDFSTIDKIIANQKKSSLEYLGKSLSVEKYMNE